MKNFYHRKKYQKKHLSPLKAAVGRSRPLRAWLTYASRLIQLAQRTGRINLESGMQEPYPEAVCLARHALLQCRPQGRAAFHAMEPPYVWRARLRRPPPPLFPRIFNTSLAQRTQKRMPLAYITGEAPFAGHLFRVNPHVLIPRSRLENLLDAPDTLLHWLGHERLERILDLGTGSGCLAIALALAFPEAQVDGTDISPEALQVAAENGRKLATGGRVRWIQSDLFANLGGRRYTLIVTNPPYVNQASMAARPMEYRHEPALALDGGTDGLALVAPIVRQAANFLTPHGVLLCEVGDETEACMRARWPTLPVEWIYFHFGASGVFMARQADLSRWIHGEGEGRDHAAPPIPRLGEAPPAYDHNRGLRPHPP